MNWLQRVPWRSLGRWWIVGLAFLVIGTGILYAFVDVFHLPQNAGLLAASEVTLLIRFLVNDRWVFGHRRPTWRRLWQFHVAGAGGFTIWWIATISLTHFGVYYLIASAAGSACSVFFSMLTNFVWIWRHSTGRVAHAPVCSVDTGVDVAPAGNEAAGVD